MVWKPFHSEIDSTFHIYLQRNFSLHIDLNLKFGKKTEIIFSWKMYSIFYLCLIFKCSFPYSEVFFV